MSFFLSLLLIRASLLLIDCKTPLHDFVGAGECATAAQAAVGLNLAFEAFNITSMEQAATVIGQM